MKKIFLILIGIFLTSNSLGQVHEDVKKTLETKDFITFKETVDDLSNREKRIESHWKFLRDLTDEFKEGVFVFEKSIPIDDITCKVLRFKVNILATETQIIYYELWEKKYKEVKREKWISYDELICSFIDEVLFDSLKISFKEIFKADINEKELFITDFAYGEMCSLSGTPPDGRQQINKFVADKNKSELLKWLKSVNTEKQIYAIDGLYQLEKQEILLTGEEKEIINFITNKKGSVYVCDGCLYYRQEIGDVIKDFKL
ncbi:hypothetical protein LJC68_10370 [Bacteroidales bacterium OttesenSCG-928-B11]|nr:hypothetical protein [Bacteroidales bacterium OttesenSCG-928-B11]